MISVLTLVKNRQLHLHRLVEGLQRSLVTPAELVIVDMSDVAINAPDTGFPVKVVRLETGILHLSAARNLAASHAMSKALLFLDVDCIPTAALLGEMMRALLNRDALICADVRYLADGAVRDCWIEEDLVASSIPHPVRAFPDKGMRRETNAGLFWSLAFGIRKSTFEKVGGFEERFEGYGAEDTDFGFRAQQYHVELWLLGGAIALHQHHETIDPPLQHFNDIVRNARLFHQLWSFWPMQGWLDAFEKMQLIAMRDSDVLILRQPTSIEILASRVTSPFV